MLRTAEEAERRYLRATPLRPGTVTGSSTTFSRSSGSVAYIPNASCSTHQVRSFGVRQLAAAFSAASLLAAALLHSHLRDGRWMRIGKPASKLAGRKAAASCRTPKLCTPIQTVGQIRRDNNRKGLRHRDYCAALQIAGEKAGLKMVRQESVDAFPFFRSPGPVHSEVGVVFSLPKGRMAIRKQNLPAGIFNIVIAANIDHR